MDLRSVYDTYLAALVKADRATCEAVVRGALDAGVPVRTLYDDLFRRSLYDIGEQWQANRISVATEHLATAMTEYLLNRVVAPSIMNPQPSGRTIVVSCVANEFHQVGARMVADICEMKGWDSHFLGANTTLEDVFRLIDQTHPDVLALSMAVYANLPLLRRAIEAVRARYPALPIWVGGQMFQWGGQELAHEYSSVTVFSSLDQLEAELDRPARVQA